MLIDKRESVGLKHSNNSKSFIKYSDDINNGYENIDVYNCKTSIEFHDIVVNMLSNKEFNPIVTKLFILGRQINTLLVLIMQSYFDVPKNIRLNYTLYFIIKIQNERELQQIVINHSLDIYIKDFMKLYKICIPKFFLSQ